MRKNEFQEDGSKDSCFLPAMQIPNFRFFKAHERGVANKILFNNWGGIGDQMCAEPTFRFALEQFKDVTISLCADNPKLYSHLKFKKVFDPSVKKPNLNKFYVLHPILPPTNLLWEFFSHLITNCVDFASLCAIRCQLPIEYKQLKLTGETHVDFTDPQAKGLVYIHAGRHWETKTFPKDWWDIVIKTILKAGGKPVLIGANADDNRGTVDVDPSGCIDLRNKLSIYESVWVLQRAKVLLTNDSCPLHMAASLDPSNPNKTGECEIGFIASAKHPDFITHWRKGKWGYKMTNHGKGGMWQLLDLCPNKKETITAEHCPESTVRSWLPDPIEYGMWAIRKTNA